MTRGVCTTAWALEIVGEIGSTSDELIGRAIAGQHSQALMARRQLKGRGRRGRRWDAPAGNLALSVLIRPDLSSDEIGRVVLLAGLALCEALQVFVTDGRRLMLKWPNDVLLDGNKLGGVLVESALNAAGGVEWLVLGFGANLAQAPALDRPTGCLAECSDPLPSAEIVAQSVLARLEAWLAILPGDGFEAVRSAWMRAAHRAGTPLIANGRAGRFAGLSDAGHLLMEVDGTLQAVSSGDIVLAGA